MARITFGLGASHAPMVSTPLEDWVQYREKDKVLPAFLGEKLYDASGRERTFEDLAEEYGEAMEPEISPEKIEERFNACQAAVVNAAEAFAAADIDIAVVIGDDQMDVFQNDNMPAIAVYWGETMMNIAPPHLEHLPPAMKLGMWGWFDDTPTEYPGHAALGRHIIEYLTANGFDPAHMKELREGQGMAHAFTFIHKRIMVDNIVPMVPIFVNTFYEPNQPNVKRCLELGRALKQAIEAWDVDAKVGVLGSGGLSHFMVHEEVDNKVLTAFKNHDESALLSLTDDQLRSGNSEIKNWIVTAGACDHLDFDVIDYIPVYRSPAATGVGTAFATWS